MNFNEIKEVVEDAGFDPQSYSGRGMYGRKCLSFNLDRDENVVDAILDLAEALNSHVQDNPEIEFEDAIQEFKGAKSDSMGLGSVVYFPSIEWEEDDEFEEDKEDGFGEMMDKIVHDDLIDLEDDE